MLPSWVVWIGCDNLVQQLDLVDSRLGVMSCRSYDLGRARRISPLFGPLSFSSGGVPMLMLPAPVARRPPPASKEVACSGLLYLFIRKGFDKSNNAHMVRPFWFVAARMGE